MAAITFKVSLAWWFNPYIHCLATICALTGQEPNWERVNYWVKRAIKVKSVGHVPPRPIPQPKPVE